MTNLHTENPGFVAGTLVHLKEGLKRIEEVRVGDWLLSYPEDELPPARLRMQDEYVYRQVTATFGRDDEPVCEVIAWDLGNNIKDTLKLTPSQPIFLKGEGWVLAEALKFGNALLTSEFANLLVKQKQSAEVRTRTYSLQVDQFRTYYVGELGAWVHSYC